MSNYFNKRINQELSDEEAKKIVAAVLKTVRGYKPLDEKATNKEEKTMRESVALCNSIKEENAND